MIPLYSKYKKPFEFATQIRNLSNEELHAIMQGLGYVEKPKILYNTQQCENAYLSMINNFNSECTHAIDIVKSMRAGIVNEENSDNTDYSDINQMFAKQLHDDDVSHVCEKMKLQILKYFNGLSESTDFKCWR